MGQNRGSKRLTCLAVLTLLLACESSGDPTPGKQLIAAIQEDIAAADSSPDSYYDKEYRIHEPRAWTKIAGWIAEDAVERQFVHGRPADGVLDLGCGYGTLLAYAAMQYGTDGVCLDVIPFLQPAVRSRYSLSFVETDIERDPFPAGRRFDAILMTEVLEHLNFDPVPTLRKAHGALRDGGSFFLSTPDADAGWGRNFTYYESLDEIPPVDPDAEWIDGHIWHYNREELVGVLAEAGFEIKRIELSEGTVGGHFNVWAVRAAPAPQ